MSRILIAVLIALATTRSANAQEYDDHPEAVHAPSAEPGAPPMPPPMQPAPPQAAARQVQAPPPAPENPGGQWVYTSQYGWVWMPYGTQYTYQGTANDQYPQQYVFYPSRGWVWVTAPWVWGWGAYPYFGAIGPSRFGWYRGLYSAGWGWGGYRHYWAGHGWGHRGVYGGPRVVVRGGGTRAVVRGGAPAVMHGGGARAVVRGGSAPAVMHGGGHGGHRH